MKTTIKPINYLQYEDKLHSYGETNTEISETIPGQAMTINEVLLRFQQGTLPNIVKDIYFDDIDDFNAIDPTLDPAFDLVDADNILNDIEIARLEKSKQKEAKDYEMSKKKKADSDEDIGEDEVQGRMKSE